jgi:cell division protease FtsH
MDKKYTFNIGYVFFAFALIGLFQFWMAYRDTAQLSYSELMRLVADGKVATVTVTETMVEGTFKAPENGKTAFLANRVDPAAAAVFEKAGVQVSGASESNWLTTLMSWILPALVFFGLWAFLFRGIAGRQGMGGWSISENPRQRSISSATPVSPSTMWLVPMRPRQSFRKSSPS